MIRLFIFSTLCFSLSFASFASIDVGDPQERAVIAKLGDNVKLQTGSLIVLHQALKDSKAMPNSLYTIEILCRHKERGQDECKAVRSVKFKGAD